MLNGLFPLRNPAPILIEFLIYDREIGYDDFFFISDIPRDGDDLHLILSNARCRENGALTNCDISFNSDETNANYTLVTMAGAESAQRFIAVATGDNQTAGMVGTTEIWIREYSKREHRKVARSNITNFTTNINGGYAVEWNNLQPIMSVKLNPSATNINFVRGTRLQAYVTKQIPNM